MKQLQPLQRGVRLRPGLGPHPCLRLSLCSGGLRLSLSADTWLGPFLHTFRLYLAHFPPVFSRFHRLAVPVPMSP